MDDAERTALQNLLTDQRIGSLSVLIESRPFGSLVPFAMTELFGAALIHASQLAHHSQGLTAGAPFSLLIHEQDAQPETNPAQLARVALQGTVRPFNRQEESYSEARNLYLAKFPKSRMTFQLEDFTLYALQVASGRFVAGFAKTFDLTPEGLAELA